ncbi:MAG: ester cyclase [Pseudomonadota bacterium]
MPNTPTDPTADFRAKAYDGDVIGASDALKAAAPDAVFQLAHPFNTLGNVEAFLDRALKPLAAAFPDLERRDQLRLRGKTEKGIDWIGCAGAYFGTFTAPFLDIPPTRHLATLRYHEFYRIEDGKIAEYQAIWDFPHLMMKAGCWPLGPSLGVDWLPPAPASGDGLTPSGDGTAAMQIVADMLDGLARHAEHGPEAMDLPRYWHPQMLWYGPAGIGTARGIEGFRRWHQIPYLDAFPDRRGRSFDKHLFAQGNYVGYTSWPGMEMSHTGGGWLGLPPGGKDLTMRSLDFWRIENGLIRENWVLVDILDAAHQMGVDVLSRMREMTGQGPAAF